MIDYSQRLDENELAIFLLHGVVKKSRYIVRNYKKKHLEEDYFYKAMISLKDFGTPLSLNEALHLIDNEKPFPKNAFAITFDDGFENNYTVAAPILDDLNIPATFYISTGMVNQNSMSWIDQIELCFEQIPVGRIKLPWENQYREFDNRDDLIEILNEIRRYVKSHREIVPDEIVSYVFSSFEMEKISQSNDPLDKKLSWSQVSELNSNELFTVGGHAHNHEILSFLSESELNYVINTSISYLRDKAAIETIHYSYPEGLAHCYSEKVIVKLKSVGIRMCPTAIDGTNTNVSDPFHLKRIFMV